MVDAVPITDGTIVNSILNTLVGQQAEIRKVTEALQEVKVGFTQVATDMKHLSDDMKLQRDHAERIVRLETRIENMTATVNANTANAKAALTLAVSAGIGCAGLLLQLFSHH